MDYNEEETKQQIEAWEAQGAQSICDNIRVCPVCGSTLKILESISVGYAQTVLNHVTYVAGEVYLLGCHNCDRRYIGGDTQVSH
jgi:hypothetical protein